MRLAGLPDLASQSAADRHSPFLAAHSSSLETQQPKLVLSQLPTKMLLERSQSAEAEHEPPTASHCVVFEIFFRP